MTPLEQLSEGLQKSFPRGHPREVLLFSAFSSPHPFSSAQLLQSPWTCPSSRWTFRIPQPLVLSQKYCRTTRRRASYNWEASCSTNGKCIAGLPFLHCLEARKVSDTNGGECCTNWRCTIQAKIMKICFLESISVRQRQEKLFWQIN